MPQAAPVVGFVGLGNMGSVLAANLLRAGHDVIAHDLAGPDRSPDGATFVTSLGEVAERADTVVLSLPDGDASERVCRALAAVSPRRLAHLVDTSTIGVAAARDVAGLLSAAGIGYVDAPVSGGVAGARARTLSVMVAGTDAACAAVEEVLAGLSDRRHRVGERPGMAQALKLANNFLSATALAATSEAIAFGTSAGLDMATMLDVLNASSGQSAATSDKFVHHVLTGRYSSGFANSLMAKDLHLYLDAAADQGAPTVVGQVTAAVWERFARSEPGADFTRIYPYVGRRGRLGRTTEPMTLVMPWSDPGRRARAIPVAVAGAAVLCLVNAG
jgi:3-hydroxyisobutyrate dehydrogenase-like beta-hydroxyacid dehydrogenase